ncbi:MAG: protein kinase [Gemmatimonadetes bacterium]|nr:protein kinase [Gemmatimonadota bacterium]
MSGPTAQLQSALADRYLIERELGRGGMATVYLARDLRHHRQVALKVLNPAVATSLGADRFLREIEVAAGLQHPNIVTVFDSGDARGSLWFTMPYVEGETLRDRLQREGQLPLGDALRIATDAARALEHAHQHGVLHRDVKPENLLLTNDGSTMVSDFGIARAWGEVEGMTETGVVVGTPAYMSPEQAAGERTLDARTDIYSLGCVLYEMLAGEKPYHARTAQGLLAKRLSQPVPPLHVTRDIPTAVEETVTRALARAPADRHASAGELARALQALDVSGRSASVPTRGRPARRRWLAWGTLATVLAGGGVLATRLIGGGDADLPASVGVLPFADLSEARDQEYFSDGLTDELITSLSKVNGIQVAARTSSFRFKGQDVDVKEVGRELHVGSILEGSVRRSGDRVRITAQLVSTRDGYQLWADAYDRRLADVFAVQEDIARAIASALQVTLGTRDNGVLEARPTGDVQAHDLYLKGRFAWNQRTAAGMQEAVQYLEEAVARDPGFALAWAALADAYVLVIPYSGASQAETWPKARAAAERALALDSTSGEAHTALAYGTMIYDWDWAAAEKEFRQAIAVDPTYPTGHQWYGDFLWSQGRLDEALEQMRKAQRLDPLSLVIGTELGTTYYLRRQYDQAEQAVREVFKLDPNYPHGAYLLGQIRIQEHRYPEAIESLRKALDLGGFQEDLAGALAYAYAASGDKDAATRYTAELEKRLAEGTVGPFALALAYAGQEDLTRAFAYLSRTIDVRDPFLPEDFFDPLLDPLRADPRFAALEKRMGVGGSSGAS